MKGNEFDTEACQYLKIYNFNQIIQSDVATLNKFIIHNITMNMKMYTNMYVCTYIQIRNF